MQNAETGKFEYESILVKLDYSHLGQKKIVVLNNQTASKNHWTKLLSTTHQAAKWRRQCCYYFFCLLCVVESLPSDFDKMYNKHIVYDLYLIYLFRVHVLIFKIAKREDVEFLSPL